MIGGKRATIEGEEIECKTPLTPIGETYHGETYTHASLISTLNVILLEDPLKTFDMLSRPSSRTPPLFDENVGAPPINLDVGIKHNKNQAILVIHLVQLYVKKGCMNTIILLDRATEKPKGVCYNSTTTQLKKT